MAFRIPVLKRPFILVLHQCIAVPAFGMVYRHENFCAKGKSLLKSPHLSDKNDKLEKFGYSIRNSIFDQYPNDFPANSQPYS